MDGSPIAGEPHTVAYVAVFLDIPKPTLYRWMQQGDLPYEDYGGLTDRYISIEDMMRVKAVKRPGRPKKRDAERVRNRPVNYGLGARDLQRLQSHSARQFPHRLDSDPRRFPDHRK